MPLHFFFEPPRVIEGGSVVEVLVSPDHDAQSIVSASELTTQLRYRIGQAGIIEFTDAGDNSAETRIGVDVWNIGLVQVKLEIQMPLPCAEVTRRLEQSLFAQGFPKFAV